MLCPWLNRRTDTLPPWGWHFHRAVPGEPPSHQHFPFGAGVLCWLLPSLRPRPSSACCPPSLPPSLLKLRVFIHLPSSAPAMNTLGRSPLLLASVHGLTLSRPLGFCTCDDAGAPSLAPSPPVHLPQLEKLAVDDLVSPSRKRSIPTALPLPSALVRAEGPPHASARAAPSGTPPHGHRPPLHGLCPDALHCPLASELAVLQSWLWFHM